MPRGTVSQTIVDEGATLIIEGEGTDEIGGAIIICMLDGNLQWIYSTHPSYMALQYPFLFPYEINSWGIRIPLARGSTSNS